MNPAVAACAGAEGDPATALLDPWLDASHKGWPHLAPPLRRSQVGLQGWRVLDGDLPLPLAVIRQSRLEHNIAWLQRYAHESGLGLAPHGKTTLSPQLFQRQLAAGAWGLSVANVQQLRVGIAAGVRRALIANQVFDAQDLAGLAACRRAHPDLRALFLLDSAAQLEAIEAWWRPDAGEPFEVLLELGVAGGRTGVRSHDDALALARRAHASAAVRLAGIECYEGLGVTGDDASDTARTHALMQRVQDAARQCDAERLWDSADLIVSAGGSSVFDLVVPGLRLQLSRPVHGLLRSGCAITHDQGAYRRYVSAIERRLGCGTSLQAALEVWALVQSLPEPGLAILNAGRRDISFDMGLPLPIGWAPKGAGAVQTPGADWQITGLNDQHAHLRGNTAPLRVGDRIVLGLSHPCTTFDKWRWMPVVDEDYRVVDAIATAF
jgi:D-serine dehydratase